MLVLIGLVWAGSFVVVDIATKEIDPIDLGFLRFLVATPLMILVLFLTRKEKTLPKKEIPSLIVLGLTGVTFLYVFQFIGIRDTTASTASVLINTNVIFIVFFSAIFLKERFSRKKLTGVLFAFFGVILVIYIKISNAVLNDAFFIGSIFMILSALCWAIYTIVGKRLLEQYDVFVVTTYAFIFGTILYIPFVFFDILETVQNASINSWMAVIYLAVFCSVIGYVIWYYALQKIETSKAAVHLSLIPMFTIILSSILLKEMPTILFIVGAILIICGVDLTQRS